MSKQRVSAKNTQLSQDNNGNIIGSQQYLEYNGPLPHPSILKGFGEIDSSFPNRIITMAENHAKTEDEVQKKNRTNKCPFNSFRTDFFFYIRSCRNRGKYFSCIKRKYSKLCGKCCCCHSTISCRSNIK